MIVKAVIMTTLNRKKTLYKSDFTVCKLVVRKTGWQKVNLSPTWYLLKESQTTDLEYKL